MRKKTIILFATLIVTMVIAAILTLTLILVQQDRYEKLGLPSPCRLYQINGKYYYRTRGEPMGVVDPDREVSSEIAKKFYESKPKLLSTITASFIPVIFSLFILSYLSKRKDKIAISNNVFPSRNKRETKL